MSLTESVQSTQLERVPAELETTTAKLVYVALDAAGAATVDDLRDALDLQKLVLFETLRTLESKGLVESDGRRYAPA